MLMFRASFCIDDAIRGDDSDGAAGTFFEGAMVRGYVSDETEAAVQASIVAAGYGH